MTYEATFLIINVRVISIGLKYYENERAKDRYQKDIEGHSIH